ncbi:hypothetical protein [Nocardia africana]
MSDLSAAEIAEGRRLLAAVVESPTADAFVQLANWAAPRWAALLDAAEKVADLEHRLDVTRRALETEKRLHGETCELAGDLRRRLEKREAGR